MSKLLRISYTILETEVVDDDITEEEINKIIEDIADKADIYDMVNDVEWSLD